MFAFICLFIHLLIYIYIYIYIFFFSGEFFFLFHLLNLKDFTGFQAPFIYLCYPVESRLLYLKHSKWGSMRNTLSSPGIAVVENGRSCWRNVVDGLVSGARRSGLVSSNSSIMVPIQGNGWPIYHQPTEKMRPLKLPGCGWFIWFGPMEGFTTMFQFQPECEVRIAPLHGSKLSMTKGTLVNWFVFTRRSHQRSKRESERERERQSKGSKKSKNTKQVSWATSIYPKRRLDRATNIMEKLAFHKRKQWHPWEKWN